MRNQFLNDTMIFFLIYAVSFLVLLLPQRGNYESLLGKTLPNLVAKNNLLFDLMEVIRPEKYFVRYKIVKILGWSLILGLGAAYLNQNIFNNYLFYWLLFLVSLLLIKIIPLIFKRLIK